MHAIRATILENLGKTDEAKASQKIATAEHTPYSNNIYLDFHEKLKTLR